jgi:hypothetical protein
MPASLLALQIFLILLPGFSAAYIVQALATRRTQSDFERIVEALVFSFLIYVCYIPLNGGKLPFHIQHDPTGKLEDTVLWEPAQLAWLAAVSVLFALLAVAYIKFDGHRIFRAMRLTERTTHNSIWNDVFEHEAIDGQPIQVELVDGKNVLGVLMYYSDDSEDGSIYLKQASWVDADGQPVEIPGPGILLTRNCGIRCVSLLNPAEDDTAESTKRPTAG